MQKTTGYLPNTERIKEYYYLQRSFILKNHEKIMGAGIPAHSERGGRHNQEFLFTRFSSCRVLTRQ